MATDKIIDGNRISETDPLPVGGSFIISSSPFDPATDIVAVTKSDGAADPSGPFRGIIMDAVGAVKLRTSAGSDITLPSGLLAAGTIHPIRFTRVWSTGTGSQNIYGVK